MKLQILSDLHLESQAFTLKVHPEADAVVLAGDVAAWSARERMLSLIKSCSKPVLYVPGNHEAYKTTRNAVWDLHAHWKEGMSHFHPLSHYPHEYHHGDVVVIGCTLWTNFSLPFMYEGKVESRPALAEILARNGISDFAMIDGFTTQECEHQYNNAVGYLRLMLERYADKKVVVVTHFLPSGRSIDAKYAGSALNPYFATDLEFLMQPNVKLWIHGHTHASCDYMVRETRVVCNPRGYNAKENRAFTSQLLVEV